MDKLTANELRIGNLVRLFLGVGDNGAEYKEYEINGVYTDPYGSSHWLFGNTWIQISDNLHPIPLTEEWLVRLGFEKLAGCLYLNTGSIEFYYTNVLVGIDIEGQCLSLPHINHVHQLQNLYFALTGEELTTNQIKNESI